MWKYLRSRICSSQNRETSKEVSSVSGMVFRGWKVKSSFRCKECPRKVDLCFISAGVIVFRRRFSVVKTGYSLSHEKDCYLLLQRIQNREANNEQRRFTCCRNGPQEVES